MASFTTTRSSDESAGAGLPLVQRQILRHQVLDGLRTAILAGAIDPGTRLLEVTLSQQLGVSRGPVREAIRQLEQEGLVEFFPHRGAIVVGVGEDEIEPIYEIRALLEARSFERASLAASDADLAELGQLVDSMLEAVDQGDFEAVVELDLRFHRRVVDLSGFRLLARLWDSIDSLVRIRSFERARRQVNPTRDVIAAWRTPALEHRELIDALATRRSEPAAAAARLHVERAIERLRASSSSG